MFSFLFRPQSGQRAHQLDKDKLTNDVPSLPQAMDTAPSIPGSHLPSEKVKQFLTGIENKHKIQVAKSLVKYCQTYWPWYFLFISSNKKEETLTDNTHHKQAFTPMETLPTEVKEIIMGHLIDERNELSSMEACKKVNTEMAGIYYNLLRSNEKCFDSYLKKLLRHHLKEINDNFVISSLRAVQHYNAHIVCSPFAPVGVVLMTLSLQFYLLTSFSRSLKEMPMGPRRELAEIALLCFGGITPYTVIGFLMGTVVLGHALGNFLTRKMSQRTEQLAASLYSDVSTLFARRRETRSGATTPLSLEAEALCLQFEACLPTGTPSIRP